MRPERGAPQFFISDETWAVLGPLLTEAKGSWRGRKPGSSDRLLLEALLFLADSGCKWRRLPERFGAWDVVYNRFRRWLAAGIFDRLFALLACRAEFGEVRRALFDSTVVRADCCAAGAGAKKGGQKEQALGRSRGGLSTKIHLAVTDAEVPLALHPGPGQGAEVKGFEPPLEGSLGVVGELHQVVADRA